MNSHLPNMRLLTIPSQKRGEDWFGLSKKLDQNLEGLSMDLADEAVYLLFSGKGEECLVARSVIGPKKAPAAPLGLTDWKASPVRMEKLSAETMEEVLKESEARGRSGSPFFIKIERRLKSELELSIYAIFHE